jgi:putative DNA primase/helicase
MAENNPSRHEPAQVVEFPNSDERARRLRIEIDRLARLPTVEWMYYVESGGYAEKHDINKTKLKAMVEAVIKENEKKKREDRGELRRREDRAEKQTNTAKRESERKQERKGREEERKRERDEREAGKEAERKDREKQKAFAAIVKLPSSEHEAKLKTLARQLGEDVEVLREEFAELRSEEEEKIKRGEVEPWDQSVDTQDLLDEVTAQFGKYIIVHDRVIAPIIPLWICFAWVHKIAIFSPILIFQGADTGMAKTAASKIVSLLTPRAYMIVEPTGPAFYRFVDSIRPTLVLDDADRLLPRRPDLAAIVNASWMRGVPIPRVDAKGDVHLFDAFGPRVLNGINLLAHLAPTTRTRCITVQLLPLLEEEKDSVTSTRYAEDDENFVVLRRKLLRWATDNMMVLKGAKPKMPAGIFSRLEENFHLLLATADLAGGGWPAKARAAAIKRSREPTSRAWANVCSRSFSISPSNMDRC